MTCLKLLTCIEHNDLTLVILMFVNRGRNTIGASHCRMAVLSMTQQVLHRSWTILIGCAVEIFPPPGHTGIWCSGNTPSSALCNEESCGSIPSTSDSFYENSNIVGILGAVGREGRNSHLSHYHETSGLAQTREELVHTTRYIYKILHCHTETRVPHREAISKSSTYDLYKSSQSFLRATVLVYIR